MAKNKDVKIPTKKTLNLYQPDYKNDPKVILKVGIAVLVIIIALFSKFFIYDKVVEINAINEQTKLLKEELSEYQERYAKYNELKEEYYRYSDSSYKDEEMTVDRTKILSIVTDLAVGYIEDINQITINDNTVQLSVTATSLDAIKEYKVLLENNSIIENVVVASASRGTGLVSSSISFECIPEED